MSDVQVSRTGAAAARRAVDAMGQDLENSLRYPLISMNDAPLAMTARDDLRAAWDTRREVELDGVEALSLVIQSIEVSFSAADSMFNQALLELEIAGAERPEGVR